MVSHGPASARARPRREAALVRAEEARARERRVAAHARPEVHPRGRRGARPRAARGAGERAVRGGAGRRRRVRGRPARGEGLGRADGRVGGAVGCPGGAGAALARGGGQQSRSASVGDVDVVGAGAVARNILCPTATGDVAVIRDDAGASGVER